jgi:hypothetical protein
MIAEPKPKESPHRFARLTVPEDYRKLDKLPPYQSIHLLIKSIVAYQRYMSPIRLRKRLAVGASSLSNAGGRPLR